MIDLVKEKHISSAYGRTLTAYLEYSKCMITGEETWCICIDTSDDEYGVGVVSIKHINEVLNNNIKKESE